MGLSQEAPNCKHLSQFTCKHVLTCKQVRRIHLLATDMASLASEWSDHEEDREWRDLQYRDINPAG